MADGETLSAILSVPVRGRGEAALYVGLSADHPAAGASRDVADGRAAGAGRDAGEVGGSRAGSRAGRDAGDVGAGRDAGAVGGSRAGRDAGAVGGSRGAGRDAGDVGAGRDAGGSRGAARIALGALDRVDLVRGERQGWTVREADGARVATVTLADARMSSQHARLTRVGAAWIAEDLGSKNGTWVGDARAARTKLVDRAAIVVGHTVLVFRESGGEHGDAARAAAPPTPGLATLSPAIAAAFARLATAAETRVPVEITGESGTGKELVARAVHALSRRTGRFVAVNCGAIAPSVLEAELFGVKRGAFTGAVEDRAGLLRDADGGTLFLDEIAELPVAAQVALLRVLQDGEVRAVGGGSASTKVDVRVVTATHDPLDAEVAAGRFRADLRARLLGVAVPLVPLRDRPEDLAILVGDLLRVLGAPAAVTFSIDAAAALYRHAWPLNVRELERALAAALAVARGHRIELGDLPAALTAAPVVAAAPVTEPDLSDEDRALRAALVAAIDRHDGNLAAVARDLGKDRTQIRRWMTRFGLSR